jgi:hypothetical protein
VRAPTMPAQVGFGVVVLVTFSDRPSFGAMDRSESTRSSASSFG